MINNVVQAYCYAVDNGQIVLKHIHTHIGKLWLQDVSVYPISICHGNGHHQWAFSSGIWALLIARRLTFQPQRSSSATKLQFVADEDLCGWNVLLLTSLLWEGLKYLKKKFVTVAWVSTTSSSVGTIKPTKIKHYYNMINWSTTFHKYHAVQGLFCCQGKGIPISSNSILCASSNIQLHGIYFDLASNCILSAALGSMIISITILVRCVQNSYTADKVNEA